MVFFYFKIILTWSPEEGININQNWIFGKEFFKIFLVSFDKEKKVISFYYKEKGKKFMEEKVKEKNWKSLIIFLIMFFMSIIIIVLFVKFSKLKKILKNRNRLNVLEVELTENNANKNK